MRFSLEQLFKFVCVVTLMVAAVATYARLFAPHRVGTTSAVANRMMWPGCQLPREASDVTYCVDFGGCEAEFAVSESDFLAWCASHQRKPVPIESPLPYFQTILLPDDPTLVVEGYTFDVPPGRGVFDAKRSRAAFCASTFP